MSRRGVVLQLEKSFWHPEKGLFTDIPFLNGSPQQHTFLSTWVTPPGGSKGEVEWHSQPAAVVGNPDEYIRPPRKSMWRLSPFYHKWMALFAMGAPLGAEMGWGGISLPILPKASSRFHYQWLTYMSTRTLGELIVGVGLAPATGAGRSIVDNLCKQWLDELYIENQKVREYNASLGPYGFKEILITRGPRAGTKRTVEVNKPLLLPLVAVPDAEDGTLRRSVTVAYRNALGKVRSMEFYLREFPVLRTPSMRLYLEKFSRKVRGSPAIAGNYRAVRMDVTRKTFVFLRYKDTHHDEFRDDQTQYGLEASSPIRQRQIAPGYIVEA